MTILTADGCVDDREVAQLAASNCCLRSLCDLNACAMMCIFVKLLPNGPLWDRAKSVALERFSAPTCDANGQTLYCDPNPDDECRTMVDFAAYTGYRFYHLLLEALWPALRESNPATAVTTQQEWLDRLGWEDCFNNACRSNLLGPLTPFEQEPAADSDTCVPTFIGSDVPADLQCAVNRGIILALKRLQMSPIPNLCGINWVIEPLGAVLTPYRVLERANDCEKCTNFSGDIRDPCNIPADAQFYPVAERFEICKTSETIEACQGELCSDQVPQSIQAWYITEVENCLDARDTCHIPDDQNFMKVYPGVLAAQCIALSMLPTDLCVSQPPIVRCC